MKKTTTILTALSVLAAGGFAAKAQVSGDVAQVESNPSPTANVSLTSGPIITYIGSQPGTGDGYSYTKYAIFAQDSSGSIDLFGVLPSGSTYSPAVGDAVAATGTYSPFDSIPEIASLTAISAVSTGNTVPAPAVYNDLATVDVSTLPSYVAGFYLGLNNITIETSTGGALAPGAVFPTHANGTYDITDGTRTITMFQYASSYSAAGALGGTVIPQGPVDLTGIVDEFDGSPEFIPFTITPVSTPEPASIALAVMGGGVLLAGWRRRK